MSKNFNLKKILTVIAFAVISIVWGYGSDWLPYYARFFAKDTIKVVGSLSNFQVSCNQPLHSNGAFCSDQYVIPKALLPENLTNKSIGLGFLTSEIITGCVYENKFEPLIHVGEIEQPLKRINAYRNYRSISLDLFKCNGDLAIQAWVKKDDVRHGLISGKVVIGDTPSIEALYDLINYFTNGILLTLAFLAVPILIMFNWLKKLFRRSENTDSFFLQLNSWLITSLFLSGLIMIVLPIPEAQVIYRRALNISVCFSRLMVCAYFLNKYDRNKPISKFFSFLQKPLFSKPTFINNAIFSPALLLSFVLLNSGKYWQVNYVYFSIALDAMCLALSFRSLTFFLYCTLAVLSNLKMLNLLWAPESSTAIFFIILVSIYEVVIMIRNEISQTLLKLLSNTTDYKKFSAQVAHDIRSPLGVLKMLIEDVQWRADQEEVKAVVHSSLSKISSISKSLIDDRTIDSVKRSTNLEPMREAIANVQLEFNNRLAVEIITTLPTSTTFINLDPINLYRVTQNLVKNAFECNGVTYISVECTLQKDRVDIKVKNNGKLPSDQTINDILNFGGTYNKENGVGLGLDFCKDVASQSGNKLTLARIKDNFVATVTFNLLSATI